VVSATASSWVEVMGLRCFGESEIRKSRKQENMVEGQDMVFTGVKDDDTHLALPRAGYGKL